ncbi:cupin domain-containing protein [Arthrobacter sp. I2-34]|uniref:Cupin domain-containing protein n=1 Tax=Arthrobacter hankyongi TaxID=2904801 RepID=A0ABS9L5N0_9MICC|nr:cupin domain-containing protein [Arthrobacter hankyongi]MCG2621992.1 cupin domain-containing protein [Arthrobacter hankyongi]
MTTRHPVRRVVTGHDDQGRAIILSDGPAPNHWSSDQIPGFGATVPWLTTGSIDHVTDEDPAAADTDIPSFPGAGETILRIADFPPDSVYPDEAGSVIFSEIDGHDEAEAGSEHSSGKHFWFHRTDSLDYAVVLDGEITLLVDEGEATLRAGDVAVQRATSHAWSNRTNKTARVLFVLIGTEPLSASEIAVRRRALSETLERT